MEIAADLSRLLTIKKNQPYNPGFISTVKIVFNAPVSRNVLGTAPFDLYAKLTNRSIDFNYPEYAPRTKTENKILYEIHLPGKYLTPANSDVYISANGMPWALLISDEWAWPLEGVDIRAPYPKFESWIKSSGGKDDDWYKTIPIENIYPLPRTSNLAANISEVGVSMPIGVGIALLTGSGFLRYRMKHRESRKNA